ncbi:hypothetical protein GB937_000910 [Aspergillus fischeri]|nr:hypothetical protein GB937_000910 [Aspergillus fischeri]
MDPGKTETLIQAPSEICKYEEIANTRRPDKPGVPNFVYLYETSECCTLLAVSPGLLGSVSVEIRRMRVIFQRQTDCTRFRARLKRGGMRGPEYRLPTVISKLNDFLCVKRSQALQERVERLSKESHITNEADERAGTM